MSADRQQIVRDSYTAFAGSWTATEIVTFDDEDRIVRVEVYFGWNLE
jgi:hypothetical protein